MGKPLSMDLRSRALAAVDEGMSCRAAAVRFGVAAAAQSDGERAASCHVPDVEAP
jgi:transposase